jgi:hypothetical protein
MSLQCETLTNAVRKDFLHIKLKKASYAVGGKPQPTYYGGYVPLVNM